MTPHVIDVNERGGAAWTQGFVPKVVSRIEVMDELVGRRNHCA